MAANSSLQRVPTRPNDQIRNPNATACARARRQVRARLAKPAAPVLLSLSHQAQPVPWGATEGRSHFSRLTRPNSVLGQIEFGFLAKRNWNPWQLR